MQGYHTMTHYYDLRQITTKTEDLKRTYLEIIKDLDFRNDFTKVQGLVSTLNSTLRLVENKLNDLHVPLSSSRPKRGLINGLGSIIKFVTGNLDFQDQEKYDSIVNHLQKNQQDLQTQIKSQYSINEAVQNNFNKIMALITSNNNELKTQFTALKGSGHFSRTRLTDGFTLLEYHQIVLNMLLNVIQDIENSLIACKTGILHPSVLDPHTLFLELTKLSKFYGNKFLNFDNHNLFEIQSYIKVRCYVGIEEIVYFLDVPIVDPEDYMMYHLEPLPTFVGSEFVTILPTAKYFLKSPNKIFPIDQNCPQGHLRLCPNYLVSPIDTLCESKFLLTGSTSECKFIKLITDSNHLKLMLEINKYLLFFPHGDTITIIQQGSTETRTLFGIYLVSPGKDHILYHNQTLFAPHNELAGTPIIITDVALHLSKLQQPEKELNLKDLELQEINLQNLHPIEMFDGSTYLKPSLWTLLLYFTLIAFLGYTFIHYRRHVKKTRISMNN